MRTPKYRHYKAKNLGFVEWQGKRRYFSGPYNSDASLSAYRKFLRETVLADPAAAKVDPSGMTVLELTARFLLWAEKRYKQGRNSEFTLLKIVARKLTAQAGSVLVANFGARAFKEFRDAVIKGGLLKNKEGESTDLKNSRQHVNNQMRRAKLIFKWGCEQEMVPGGVLAAIKSVAPLSAGTCEAPDCSEKPRPTFKMIAKIAEHLHQPARDMLWMQWFTGARSQSICLAAVEQLDTNGPIWTWRPRHKMEHKKKVLELPIGPRCQSVLANRMREKKSGLLFSPREVHQRYRKAYTSMAYRRAIVRACEAAGLPEITPHMIRHARGETTRAACGVEAAQAILGHGTLDATQIYTQVQYRLAVQAARTLG